MGLSKNESCGLIAQVLGLCDIVNSEGIVHVTVIVCCHGLMSLLQSRCTRGLFASYCCSYWLPLSHSKEHEVSWTDFSTPWERCFGTKVLFYLYEESMKVFGRIAWTIGTEIYCLTETVGSDLQQLMLTSHCTSNALLDVIVLLCVFLVFACQGLIILINVCWMLYVFADFCAFFLVFACLCLPSCVLPHFLYVSIRHYSSMFCLLLYTFVAVSSHLNLFDSEPVLVVIRTHPREVRVSLSSDCPEQCTWRILHALPT